MTITRRGFLDFLKTSCAVTVLPFRLRAQTSNANAQTAEPSGAVVNDARSQLNGARVNSD
jgi:hypothetical protein